MVQLSSHPPQWFTDDRLHGVLADLIDKSARERMSLQHVNRFVQIELASRVEDRSRLTSRREDDELGCLGWLVGGSGGAHDAPPLAERAVVG
jgi:hypothetical protein